MDHPIAIDDGHDAADALRLSADLMDVIGRLIAYAAGRVAAARRAIWREALDALRHLVSLIALMLILAERMAARWTGHAVREACPDGDRADRHLHHPPQAWAAP